jgi:hypothetical protein
MLLWKSAANAVKIAVVMLLWRTQNLLYCGCNCGCGADHNLKPFMKVSWVYAFKLVFTLVIWLEKLLLFSELVIEIMELPEIQKWFIHLRCAAFALFKHRLFTFMIWISVPPINALCHRLTVINGWVIISNIQVVANFSNLLLSVCVSSMLSYDMWWNFLFFEI